MGRHGSAAAATATARGVVVILVGGPEEGRDGEIHLAGVGGSAGQVGDGKAGERGDGRGLAVSGGAAPASAAAAAIPVVTTTHDKSTPNQIRGGLLPPTVPIYAGAGRRVREKEKARQPQLSRFWQREKDSNPHIQSQSLLCYPYTIPLYQACAHKRRCYYSKTMENVKGENEKK